MGRVGGIDQNLLPSIPTIFYEPCEFWERCARLGALIVEATCGGVGRSLRLSVRIVSEMIHP